MVLSLIGLLAGVVWANGTETLGDPVGIDIAGGTGIIAAGTGLFSQPGTIEVTVPSGVTVEQVILYWADRTDLDNLEGAFIEDDTIVVNGTTVVTGLKIGGPSIPLPPSNVASIAFRADITALGLISPGTTSTLTVEGVDFDGGARQNNVDGAGVFVIIDDGSGAADIQVRDGSDYANSNLNSGDPILAETVPQTFIVDISSLPRDATLVLHVGDAKIDGRSSQLKISDNSGVLVDLVNPFHSTDGKQWDTLTIDFEVPAGVTEITVEVISGGPGDGGPASLMWIGAGLSVAPAFGPEIHIEKYTQTPPVSDATVCEARPIFMVMTYVGGNEITQPQLDKNGNPKASVVGDGLENTEPAFIRASGKSNGTGGVFFEGIVNFGGDIRHRFG